MSQIASNSLLGNKPTSILIFILIFLNTSNLTSETPIATSTLLETAQKIVEPETSSWGFASFGDLVSAGVRTIQSGIKYLIGVEDHPREFYVVHIKDEKNPQNNRNVLRERGHEDKGDIPLEGGKLPENSLIVNGDNPVTEYVSSSQSPPKPSAPQANPSATDATPAQHNIPIVEDKPQDGNGSTVRPKPTTADESEKDIADKPPKETPSPPDVETQVIPTNSVKDKTTKNEPTHDGKSKSKNTPQLDTALNSLLDEDNNDELETSPTNHQSSPILEKVVSLKNKVDQPGHYEAQNSESYSSMEQQNNAESQSYDSQLSPAKKLSSSVLRKEVHPQENDNSSHLPENYATIGAAGHEHSTPLRPQLLPTSTYSDSDHDESLETAAHLGKSEILKPTITQQPTNEITSDETEYAADSADDDGVHDLSPSSKVEETPNATDSQIVQPAHSDTHEAEAPEFDANNLIAMNACELEFEKLLWETKPEIFDEFTSDEEFIAYVKEKSGCSSKSQESEHANNSHPLPESANQGYDPNELIAMSECEIEYEQDLCYNYPDFCKQFESKEEFIMYVKENSGCASGEGAGDAPSADHSVVEDGSFQQHQSQDFESDGNFYDQSDANYKDNDQPQDFQFDGNFDGHRDANHSDDWASTSSQIEPTEPVITKKNGSKKKTKSGNRKVTKTKRS